MGIFDFFFKKKAKDVKIDYTLKDLKKGFLLDYFMKSWEVKKVYIYGWGDNFYSHEYLLDSGDEQMYLHIEEDDGLICSVWKKIDPLEIEPQISENFKYHDKGPKTILFQQASYSRISANRGDCREEKEVSAYQIMNWTYQNKETKDLISIEMSGETEFSASAGQYVKPFEFSNILPR